MHLFQDELAPVIFGADHCAVFDYYFANDLLAPRKSCPTCFADMKLVPRSQLSDRFAWHCKNFQCGSRSYHSVMLVLCIYYTQIRNFVNLAVVYTLTHIVSK